MHYSKEWVSSFNMQRKIYKSFTRVIFWHIIKIVAIYYLVPDKSIMKSCQIFSRFTKDTNKRSKQSAYFYKDGICLLFFRTFTRCGRNVTLFERLVLLLLLLCCRYLDPLAEWWSWWGACWWWWCCGGGEASRTGPRYTWCWVADVVVGIVLWSDATWERTAVAMGKRNK